MCDHDEERDLIERTEIILSQANTLFNRLETNIFSLKSRFVSFFAVLVAIMAFEIPLLQITLTTFHYTYSFWLFMLIIPFIPLVVSGILIFKLFWSTEYLDVEIFGDDRMDEISTFDKQELLSDFLYYLKNCYEHNYSIHTDEIGIFKKSLYCFVFGNIAFIVSIILLFIFKPVT